MIDAPSLYPVGMAKRVLKTLAQASEESGLHRNTLLRWMAKGILTRHKSITGRGHPTLVDMTELDRVQKHPPSKETP